MLFEQIEHWTGLAWFIQAALVAAGLLLLAGVLVRRKLAAPSGGVVPDEGVTLRNVLEVLVEWLSGMARERMGPDWRKYFPIVGTMFFFILVSNLMGLVPGLARRHQQREHHLGLGRDRVARLHGGRHREAPAAITWSSSWGRASSSARSSGGTCTSGC